jgi:uncharacterized protein DUF5677
MADPANPTHAMPEFASKNEYAFTLHQKLAALKARMRQAGPIPSGSKQKDVLFYFVGRAVQIAEACFLAQDFETPLFILARVLCDDMFTMYWVSLSGNNALEFEKTAFSEKARYLKRNLKNNRASVHHKITKEDATGKVIAEATKYIKGKKRIDQVAEECKLSDVYDVLFVASSLYVHGNSYDFDPKYHPSGAQVAALSMVVSLLRVMMLIWDRSEQGNLTAEEIRTCLNIQRLTGS